MVEGWHNDDYLMLFDEIDVRRFTDAYGLPQFLPNYRVLGIRSCDDFVVADVNDATFAIPTVPLVAKYLKPHSFPKPLALKPDERICGKIKWYIKPVIFGGDPRHVENVTWVSGRRWLVSGPHAR